MKNFNYFDAKQKRRLREIAKMNDDERFIDILQVCVRCIDRGQRVALDYGFRRISREKFEKELSFVKTMLNLASYSIVLYLKSKK